VGRRQAGDAGGDVAATAEGEPDAWGDRAEHGRSASSRLVPRPGAGRSELVLDPLLELDLRPPLFRTLPRRGGLGRVSDESQGEL
jgi:hypothetical protein